MLNQIVDFRIPFTPKKQVAYAVQNAFSPFGWSQHRKLFKGNVFEEIINNPVTIVTEPFKALDREVIQPLYREVIQPVGKALEKVGQGIAKDPVTFLAQVAAVAAAPFTAGQSLWALPVIAAASTAAHGGSLEQILTATAISAASAVVGGALGPGTGASGWIMNGLSTASEFGPSFAIAGNTIAFSTAQTIAQVGAGLSMAAVNAAGAAIQGRDPLAAAIPAVVGTAAGAAVNTLAGTEIFQDLGRSINELGSNVSPVVQKALTGVVSSAVAGTMAGKDATGAIVGHLATGLMEGLYSTVGVVGDLFKNDAGNITKYGAATQSLITNLVGTVAATAAQSGPMGSEFSGKLTQSITATLGTYLSGAYDALATEVKGLFDNTTKVANNINTAATNQQNLYQSWDGAYKNYEAKYAAVMDLGKQQDDLLARHAAATTQSEINSLEAQIHSVQDQLRAGYAELDTMATNIDSFASQYLESQKVTEAAQKEYYELAKLLGTKSELLTSKTNEIAKAATEKLVQDLDPTFNAEEYKKVNNLGTGVDAFTDWMARGKDLGLPTNLEAAQQDIQDNYTRLTKEMIQKQWGLGMEPPASMVASLKSKLYQQYGNNLALLKEATADNVTTAFGAVSKTIDGFLPAYNSDAAKKALLDQSINEAITPGWYQPKEFNMPAGMKFATQQDIADMMAKGEKVYTAYDDRGYSVYLKQDPNYTPIAKYDKATGEIQSTASIINAITTKDMSPTEILNYVSKANTDTLAYIVNADKAISTTQPYSSVDTSWLVQTLKSGADVIRSAANTDNAPLIYQFLAKGLDAGAGTLSGIAQVTSSATFLESMLRGVNPNDQPTMQITNYLNGMATAMRSDEMKASIQSLNNALQTKGTDVIGAVLNNAVDNPAGMINFIGTNLVAMLPGFAAGAWVGAGTTAAKELEGFAANAIQKLVGNAAVNTSRLYEIGMEAASNGLQAFNETRDLLKSKNPSMTDAQLDAEAMARAKLVAGTAALTTIGTQVVGLDKVTQNLLGAGNPGSSAFASVLNKLVSSPLSEAVGESFQSGIPQLMQEYLFKEIDPSRSIQTSIGNVLGQTTLGFVAGAGTSLAIGSLQAVQDVPNVAVEMNAAFDKAIKSQSYTMGELGTVLNQWIPPATQGATQTSIPNLVDTLRATIVPQILLANPQIASSYGSAQSYMDAVKNNLGVWEVSALSDIAESVPQFAGQVTTAREAQAILESQGLTGVTAQDALKSGIVGVTQQNQSALASDYVNRNMVSAAELRAAAEQENYAATQSEMDKLIGRGVQADVIANFIREIDPKAVTTAEATQYFKDLGYTKATAQDIAQFVKSVPETEITRAVAEWVDPRQVTRAEALNFYAALGYTPTEAEIAQYVVQGPEVVQANIQKQLEAYVDPRFVDAAEVQAMYKSMGLNAPVAASDIARLSGQYAESELAGKAKEALPIVSANALFAMLNGDPAINQNVKDEILAKIEGYKNLNMTQAEAQKAATQAVAAQLNTTTGNLLTALGATENNLLVKISNVEASLTAKIDDYKNQGLTQAEATSKALAEMSAQLGTTKSELLTQLGTTENNLIVKLASTKQELVDKIDQYRSEGLTQSEATKKALDEMSTQIGVNKADILATLGATEANLYTQISTTKQELLNTINQYRSEGLTQAQATAKALEDMSAKLGTTKTDLLAQLGATESNLVTKITATKQELLDKVAEYRAQGMAENAALQAAMADLSDQFGTTKENLLTQIGTTETALRNEITQQVTTLGNQLQQQIAANEAKGMARDDAINAAVNTVAQNLGTTRSDLLAQIGATETTLGARIDTLQKQTQTQISDMQSAIQVQMQKNLDAGMARADALDKAITDVSAQLGTTKNDLLTQMGTNQQQLLSQLGQAQTQIQTDIAKTKQDIQTQMAAYEQAGIDRDTALDLAIAGVSQDLGLTKTDLLTKMGTTEANLRQEMTTQSNQLKQQITDVATLVGKPASQVTQQDIDYVNAIIGGTQQQNLAYDVNRDGKVDQTDLTLIQQQQQIEQGQNITVTTDVSTGLPIYTDKTTGQQITGFTPAAGTQWAPTGVYAALEQQKAQQAATAKAQSATAAKTAQQAQQRQNFNQMMQMLMAAPDIGGQKVTTETPQPTGDIKYFYDWSSIFANPSQAQMMPSPYGQLNVTGPQAQKAANQPMFRMASGFAGGGIVGNDIEVGDGGSVDDLINILKGNG